MQKTTTVDPGEATGYSIWEDEDLEFAGTTSMEDFPHALAVALGVEGPLSGVRETDQELVKRLRGTSQLVVEEWQLYPWKLNALAWDHCRTARLIGAIEFVAEAAGIPTVLQAAAIKEGAVAGGAEELFLRPLEENRHANDAIMHGVYYFAQKAGERLAIA